MYDFDNEKCSDKNQICYQGHCQYCNCLGVIENSPFSTVYLHGAVDRAVASISLGDSLEGELTDDALESEDYELLSDEDLEEIIQKYV